MTFRLKTILGIALIELILLAVLIVSGISWLRDSNEQQIITNGERLSETFAIAVRDAIISTDLANLRAFTQEAIRDGDIAYIRIMDDQGQILAESNTLNEGAVPPNYEQAPSDADDRIYDIRHTVVIDDYLVGNIEIGLDVSAFSQLIQDAQKYAVFIAALEMVLVALFSLAFGSLLTKQLLTLQEGALKIQKNGPGETVPVKGKDEVAQVANAFNDMSVALSHTYEELSREKNRFKQLAVQNKMLAEIVEQSHEAYLITDLGGYVSLSNEALNQMLGYKGNETCDKDFQVLLFGDQTSEIEVYQLRDAMDKGERLSVRTECLSRTGEVIHTEITIFPIFNTAGIKDRYVFIVRDASERHEFEKMLKQAATAAQNATEAKSQFLANMSHEIRTPMNGIIGMSEMLKESSLTKEQAGFAGIINSSAKDLLQLINDILDFSKLEAKKLKLDSERFSLTDTVEEAASLAAVAAARKDLLVVIDIPPELNTEVESDELRLRQVLNNLLSNAVKFTEHGYIRVLMRGQYLQDSHSTTYTISIEDTGIGIEDDKIEDVTKAFKQVDSSTTRRYEGTGLGLSITKNLLDLFGSKLEVESEFGTGSKFSFSLTLPTFEEMESTEGALNGKHIAVINADPLHRPLIDRYVAFWQAKLTYLTTLDVLCESKTNFDAAIVLASEENDLSPEPYCPWVGVIPNLADIHSGSKGSEQRLIVRPLRMNQLLQELQLSLMIEPSSARSAVKESQQESENLASIPIAVVDDIDYNREVTKIFLTGIADNVTYLKSGAEALSHYKKNLFQILITDISMPNIDGYELTTQLRQFEKEHDVPPLYIIGLSAHAGKEDFERAISAGMDNYLTKPLKRADLIDALNQAAAFRAEAEKT
ncbi:Sensor histidine kinase RcsC [Grimontia celer]|uniref:Sensory/regulatory protein RpfC n=1 Tax=Grimontia celer TaxID=1796497 RepID=A0A128F2M5_9GAMM|nr:ATP-binding protein [Grimontia celer]CZF81052.1 Sensor histidine kinase RcsC [Grimontia celer]